MNDIPPFLQNAKVPELLRKRRFENAHPTRARLQRMFWTCLSYTATVGIFYETGGIKLAESAAIVIALVGIAVVGYVKAVS